MVQKILADCEAAMVILFGSYARGDWVEDYQANHEYVSDYDLLVIAENKKQIKGFRWREKLERKIRELNLGSKTNLIYHSIGFVNEKLKQNSYFFGDIYREGIVLYDTGKWKLEEPKPLDGIARHKKAMDEFEHWFESANEFLIDFQNAYDRDSFNKAAFELHQAVERYYGAILLVFTDYKPRTHDIEELARLAGNQHSDFFQVFPRKTESEKQHFELLKKAYIDARYSKEFNITKAELEYLAGRVQILRDLADRLCKEKIESFAE